MPKFNLTEKQALAMLKLTDDETTEIGYGGAGGGGKSIIGCAWILSQCINYPGVHYCIGRKELTNLKKTTLMSFFEVISLLKFKNEELFSFNMQTNIISFHNGSKIFLLDTAKQPTDPLYTRFGGLLLTGGFIDESNETEEKAIDIIKTRLGRWKNTEYNIKPKLLECFNPAKNHIYNRFYKAWKEKKLPKHRYFIRALPTDNPYLSEHYINQLRNADKVTKERLLYGNFEYDDDPATLVEYDAILDLFTNEHVPLGEKFISSDIAMMGRDLFLITFWEGLRCKIVVMKDKSSGLEVINDLNDVKNKNKVANSRIVCDSDGMGAFLEQFTDKQGRTHEGFLKHIKTFHGGSKAFNEKEFKNLKSECAFKLAEMVNRREIFIDCKDVEVKNRIILELEQLKRDKIDRDEIKKTIISKELMKENLCHSPDFLDCLIMRMIFELRQSRSYTIV